MIFFKTLILIFSPSRFTDIRKLSYHDSKFILFVVDLDETNPVKNIYPCNHCDYAGSNEIYLKHHTNRKHEEKNYLCDSCDYTATTKITMIQHRRTKHYGIAYSCDQCNYAASDMFNLRKHKKSSHESLVFKCDECEYVTRSEVNLRKHKQIKHRNIDELKDELSDDIQGQNLNFFFISIYFGILEFFIFGLKNLTLEGAGEGRWS